MCVHCPAHSAHMEGNRPPPPAGICTSDCPILCITKVALFVLVSMFILCLPLGDPDQRCVKMSSQQSRDAMQYVCELYRSILQAARLLRELLRAAASAARDASHHAKLRLYEFLSNHDKDDLCAVIHCSRSGHECASTRRERAEGGRGRQRSCRKNP